MKPFFFFYDLRSGSTFLANKLVKSFELVIPPETNFMERTFEFVQEDAIHSAEELEKLFEFLMMEPKFKDLGIEKYQNKREFPLSLKDFFRDLMSCFDSALLDSSYRFAIKKGSYIYHIPRILRVYPDARFILIYRDGRAVYASKKRSIYSQTGEPMETCPFRAANFWVRRVKELKYLEANYGDRCVSVKYEEMIRDLEGTLERIGNFMGLERKQESDEKKYFVSGEYDKNLHSNIDKSPIEARLNAWENDLTPKERKIFESIASRELCELGYLEKDQIHSSMVNKTISIIRSRHFLRKSERLV